MRIKRIIGLLVSLLLPVVCYFCGSNFKSLLGKGVAQVSPAAPITPTSGAHIEVPPAHQSLPTPVIPSGIIVPLKVARDPVALAYFLAEMTPISFYGKVIDQNGVPVEGATVKIGVNDGIFQDGSNYNKTTDVAGLFSITGKHGMALGVTVSKNGYYRLPQSSHVYGYAAGISSDGPIPNPHSPAVFVLRKKGSGVALIFKSSSGRVVQDGTPAKIDLESGQAGNVAAETFQIELWSNYNDQDPNTPYDWRYRISVPGGGLIERQNDLDFQAPDDGYHTADEGSFFARQDHYSRDLAKQYFLKLKDGRYARISLQLSHSFNILAYINPTPGSHDLEEASK